MDEEDTSWGNEDDADEEEDGRPGRRVVRKCSQVFASVRKCSLHLAEAERGERGRARGHQLGRRARRQRYGNAPTAPIKRHARATHIVAARLVARSRRYYRWQRLTAHAGGTAEQHRGGRAGGARDSGRGVFQERRQVPCDRRRPCVQRTLLSASCNDQTMLPQNDGGGDQERDDNTSGVLQQAARSSWLPGGLQPPTFECGKARLDVIGAVKPLVVDRRRFYSIAARKERHMRSWERTKKSCRCTIITGRAAGRHVWASVRMCCVCGSGGAGAGAGGGRRGRGAPVAGPL